MSDLTIHQIEVLKLKATLSRLEDRRLNGKSASSTVPVDTDLLEDLIDDHEALDRILEKHPEIKREEPYV